MDTIQVGGTQLEVFQYIFSIIPNTPCANTYIAGGAVVNYMKAGDIDVWIGGSDEAKTIERAQAAAKQFAAAQYPPDNSNYAPNSKLVATCYSPIAGKCIQLLTTTLASPVELMDDFDISTHRWAFSSKGVVIKGNHATLPTEKPHILTYNNKTLSRYVKICQRYGFDVDVAHLVEAGEKKAAAGMKLMDDLFGGDDIVHTGNIPKSALSFDAVNEVTKTIWGGAIAKQFEYDDNPFLTYLDNNEPPTTLADEKTLKVYKSLLDPINQYTYKYASHNLEEDAAETK